ncbi:transferase, partial [Streptomyces pharetrae CZA14]
MPTAILTGQPVPGSSIEGDLRSLGFEVRTAADAAEAETLLAQVPGDQRVAIVDARFVGHLHALRLGLTDPRFPLAAVPGAVTAQPAGRQALTRAVARENSSGGGTAVAVDSLADRVVTALDADGAAVHRPELGSLVATVPGDPQARNEARQAVAAVDDEAVRLKSAVKARDGFFTTFFISPYSRYIARWCARRGLTPNQVTTASLITALIAAGCAATGTRGGFVAAGILLIASFVLDCTDGQLARYSLQYSTLGAWLDATFDRAKEYAYYAGLALGAARGGDDVWALALGAMVLQTCRHVVDFSFNEANHDATANTSPTAALSDKLDSVGWTVWVRRMIVLPIGERWAMIAVLTALTTPRITFYALLIGCAFAAAYTTAGRVLRSLTRKANRTDRAATALADLADSGPLAEGFAAAFRNPARRLPGFAVPALALLGAAAVVATSVFTGPA